MTAFEAERPMAALALADQIHSFLESLRLSNSNDAPATAGPTRDEGPSSKATEDKIAVSSSKLHRDPKAAAADLRALSEVWGWTHGLLAHPLTTTATASPPANMAPVLVRYSVLPSPIPREALRYAYKLGPVFNNLTEKMTTSPDWLFESLKEVGVRDSFTADVLRVAARTYQTPNGRRIEDDIRLIITRSDYMIDDDSHRTQKNSEANGYGLLQVELNCISISFGGLVSSLHELHKTNLCRLGLPPPRGTLPPNPCATRLAEGLATAHRLYCERHKETINRLQTCILIVANDGERNEFDCRHILNRIVDSYDIPNAAGEESATTDRFNKDDNDNGRIVTSIHLSFQALVGLCKEHLSTPEKNAKGIEIRDPHTLAPMQLDLHNSKPSRLFIRCPASSLPLEVTVVYYRTGYDPLDYGEGEIERDAWLVRELLEKSEAVKCPNALTHLAGVKKIQALWNDREVLSKLISDPEERKLVSRVFAPQCDPSDILTDPSCRALVEEAYKNPKAFVLKPQREGGEHNIHDEAISAALLPFLQLQHPTDKDVDIESILNQMPSYILMKKIRPRIQPSVLISRRANTAASSTSADGGVSPVTVASPALDVVDCVSELGIFGVSVSDGRTSISMVTAGHLLRTKDARNNEGGVATGYAFLDSPLLV